MTAAIAGLKTRLPNSFFLFGTSSKDKCSMYGKGHRMDICVGNLPTDVTGSDLREVFELFGRVETADVMRAPSR